MDNEVVAAIIVAMGAVLAAAIGARHLWNRRSARNQIPPVVRERVPDERLTMRGISLSEAAKTVGLVDIENRDYKEHVLAPERFYQLAQAQLFISGATAHATLGRHCEHLISLLRDGKEVFLLILGPDSPDVPTISQRVGRDIAAEIRASLEIIRARKLGSFSNFQIRFLDKLPTFTAVMIDGDISDPKKNRANDRGAQIRVQPLLSHAHQHSGLVIQLANDPQIQAPCFQYFAEDVRNQWVTDGRKRPSLLA